MQEERTSVSYIEQMNRLRLLAALPPIMDMVWSYFNQLGKTICPLEALENHVYKSHPKRISEAETHDLIALLLEEAPRWCEKKEIDGKAWFKVLSKNEDVFRAAKDVLEDVLEQERAKPLTSGDA